MLDNQYNIRISFFKKIGFFSSEIQGGRLRILLVIGFINLWACSIYLFSVLKYYNWFGIKTKDYLKLSKVVYKVEKGKD